MATVISHRSAPPPTHPRGRGAAFRRFAGVVVRAQSYRNIAYLLVGLALGIAWFALLVTGVAVGISLLAVALLGIPVLVGVWYASRAFANVERSLANVLLDSHLPLERMAGPDRGNLWVRLRVMVHDRARWRELAYLALRFPVGIAAAVIAVMALTTPVLVAYAPWAARYEDEPFGDWAFSSTIEDVASSSPWSWLLVPFGMLLLVGAFHLVNAVANACGRWASAWLRVDA